MPDQQVRVNAADPIRAAFADPKISWKAKGLLAYLATLRPQVVLTVDQITARGLDGRAAVMSGLRELEDAGVLTRVRIRTADSRFGGMRYMLAGQGER